MDPISVNFAHILLSLKDSDSSSSEEEGCLEEKSQGESCQTAETNLFIH